MAISANRLSKEETLRLFSGLPRRYDLAGALLSFGQDPRWRRAMVRAVEARPDDRVLDVATGTGMLAGARAKLDARPELAARVELVRGEAESLPFPDGAFDHLTFTYLLRYVADAGATLGELARVVKPGGRIASLEFMLPPNRVARALWKLYTRFAMPPLGRLISPDWEGVGRFLGPSITELYERLPLDSQLELWSAAGIERPQARVMSLGGGVVIWGTRA